MHHKTRDQRHDEAIDRQQERNVRSVTEQLVLIGKRPGRSAKETARLIAGRDEK